MVRGAWPWQVSIQSGSGNHFEHMCGGSIIDRRHILSAAHCFSSEHRGVEDERRLRVLAGEHELYTDDDGPHDEYDVEEIIKHDGFQGPADIANDIALLRLSNNIAFNDRVNAIPLADAEQTQSFEGVRANTTCYATGWGSDGNGTATMTTLQEVRDVIPRLSQCRRWWLGVNLTQRVLDWLRENPQFGINDFHHLPDTNICFGFGHRGTCGGDSGGPLVCSVDMPDGGLSWRLVGVTSRGTSPCINDVTDGRGLPSLFTGVADFHDWIANNTRLDDAD